MLSCLPRFTNCALSVPSFKFVLNFPHFPTGWAWVWWPNRSEGYYGDNCIPARFNYHRTGGYWASECYRCLSLCIALFFCKLQLKDSTWWCMRCEEKKMGKGLHLLMPIPITVLVLSSLAFLVARSWLLLSDAGAITAAWLSSSSLPRCNGTGKRRWKWNSLAKCNWK